MSLNARTTSTVMNVKRIHSNAVYELPMKLTDLHARVYESRRNYFIDGYDQSTNMFMCIGTATTINYGHLSYTTSAIMNDY